MGRLGGWARASVRQSPLARAATGGWRTDSHPARRVGPHSKPWYTPPPPSTSPPPRRRRLAAASPQTVPNSATDLVVVGSTAREKAWDESKKALGLEEQQNAATTGARKKPLEVRLCARRRALEHASERARALGGRMSARNAHS